VLIFAHARQIFQENTGLIFISCITWHRL